MGYTRICIDGEVFEGFIFYEATGVYTNYNGTLIKLTYSKELGLWIG